MRVLLIVLALLLLPVLTLIHRYHYFRSMQGQLLVRVMAALDEPELLHVKTDPETRMNYLDVVLAGTVPEISWRDKARDRVRAIPGVRCREEDIRIRVPAAMKGRLEGDVMHLSGWLHDDATLRDAVLWLTEGKPGLRVDTSQVRVSPYVTAEDSPRRVKSPLFQPLWALIETPAVLDIMKQGEALKMTGALPSKDLKQKIEAAILGTRVETSLDAGEVRVAPCVKSAPFTTKGVELAALLKGLFATQVNTHFHADDEVISFDAEVTDEQRAVLSPLMDALGSDKTIEPHWTFQPSLYHLKTYTPVTQLPPEAMTALKAALAACTLSFSPASSAVTPEQMPALNACTQAIRSALEINPELSIVVGAHPETGGDARGAKLLAQRRAEAVIEQFADRQIPARVFQVQPFAAPHAGDPAGAARSHKVEMFVK